MLLLGVQFGAIRIECFIEMYFQSLRLLVSVVFSSDTFFPMTCDVSMATAL